MPRFEVQTESLSSASAEQLALAGRLRSIGSAVDSAAVGAAGAAGEPAAIAALSAFGQSWAASLELLAASVGDLGGNLGSAAGAYEGTDAGAMPGAGGR